MAAFYTLFTDSLRTFYGAVYGAFMTSRTRGGMLARVLRAPAGGALVGSAGYRCVAAGRGVPSDPGRGRAGTRGSHGGALAPRPEHLSRRRRRGRQRR